MASTKLLGAGSWSAYWYNGYIVSSEIARGLDIFELQPSAFISQNELDAAKLLHFDYLNAQDQQLRGVERSEEHTSELQSRPHLVCRLLLEKKKTVVI